RDYRAEIGKRLERRVGALDDPGIDPADDQRQRGAAGGENERVRGGCEEAAACENRDEIREAPFTPALRIGKTPPARKEDRRNDQRREDDDQQRREHRRLVFGQLAPEFITGNRLVSSRPTPAKAGEEPGPSNHCAISVYWVPAAGTTAYR